MSQRDEYRAGQLVRACAFALTTAEFALARRLDADVALETIASELDNAYRHPAAI